MSAGWEQRWGVLVLGCGNLGLVPTCLVKIRFLPGKTENPAGFCSPQGQSSDTPVLEHQLGFDTG